MGLTPDKQAVLERLNQEAQAAHREASEKALRAGRAAPPVPVPLKPEDVEFPKWLHKGSTQAKGASHQVPAESKLVHSAEEAKELLASGWSESPTKDAAKK